MTTRVRVVTPELLDGAVAALINTAGTQSHNAAVVAGSGGGTVTATGVTTATANTLVQRDANARTQFATPAVSADAATKGYVDTTVAGYIPTTAKGAASGVASLDGSSFLTAAQVPQYLHQHRGSGTSFPTGIRAGDTYFHNGFGCLFAYNGTGWKQAEEFAVANLAGRNALKTNYASLLHVGLRVWQTDWSVEWTWNGSDWELSAGELVGKAWGSGTGTGIFTTLTFNSWVTHPVMTSRTNGCTFDATTHSLALPVDGMWRLRQRAYYSGSAGWEAQSNGYRIRTGVQDAALTQDSVYKPTGLDKVTLVEDVVPLKSGDKVYISAYLGTNVGGPCVYTFSEVYGSMFSVEFVGPLNGATPL